MTRPNMDMADLETIETMHAVTLEMDGGLPGYRDKGALQSAIARCQNRAYYNPSADVFELIAAVGYGLIQNHPYNDGNKRTGALFTLACLDQNGYSLPMHDDQLYTFFQSVAAGQLTEEKMASFLRTHARPKEPEKHLSPAYAHALQHQGGER